MPKLDKDQYSKAEVEELVRENAEAQAEALEIAQKEAGLSDAERAVYKTLDGEAKHDFLFATVEERQVEVAKRNDQNPVVYTARNGDVFRKNDDARLVAMAKERDQERADFLKMVQEREQEQFEKRAEQELSSLPGTVQVRAAMLKAVEGIADKDVREEAVKALKAHNARMSKAFTEVGSAGIRKADDGTTGANSAHEELEAMADAYRKEHPEVSKLDAYQAVASANPDLAKRAYAEG